MDIQVDASSSVFRISPPGCEQRCVPQCEVQGQLRAPEVLCKSLAHRWSFWPEVELPRGARWGVGTAEGSGPSPKALDHVEVPGEKPLCSLCNFL